MDLLKMAIGLALIGAAVVAQVRLSRHLAGRPAVVRLRVGGVAVVGLCAYFAITWTNVGLGTWWVVPVGFAAAAALAWATYPVARVQHRG